MEKQLFGNIAGQHPATETAVISRIGTNVFFSLSLFVSVVSFKSGNLNDFIVAKATHAEVAKEQVCKT